MHVFSSGTVRGLRRSFQWLLALGVLAVPGLGQFSSPGWRVAEEEEQNSRDYTESAACGTAEGLRLRGRVIAAGERTAPLNWTLSEVIVSRSKYRDLATGSLASGHLNGCGAFLRC
jgi:hypothetical protein